MKCFKLFSCITFLFVFVFSWQIYSQTCNVETLMHLVENGLQPSIRIHGEDSIGMHILDRMKYYKVPTVSIAIVNEGKIEWSKAYNLSVQEHKGTTKTLLQAASISKPIAAMIALSLMGKNKINLDDNVNDKLKTWVVAGNGYTEEEKVTLRRLLSHTSGLGVNSFEGYHSSLAQSEIPSIVQILKGEGSANNRAIELAGIPGNNFSYSGGGYVVIQKWIEDISQKRFSEVASEILFEPLGMQWSTYELLWPENKLSNIVCAYGNSADGPILGYWKLYPESAAAGLWTTPSELARIIIDIQNAFKKNDNSVLSYPYIKEMLTRQPGSKTGLGFWVNPLNSGSDNIEFSSSGVNHGYCAYFVGFTGVGKGAVIMTNSTDGGRLMFEILRSIAKVYSWPEGYSHACEIKKPIIIDPVIYTKYVGQYKIIKNQPEKLPVIVSLFTMNNKLFVNLSFEDKEFELIPESKTKFFTIDGEFEILFSESNNNELMIMGIKAQRV